jgi:hypothetical protein
MPKKKKTLKQKMQADQRRDVTKSVTTSHEPSPSTAANPAASGVSFSIPAAHTKKHNERPVAQPRTTAIAIDTNEYTYLSKDLIKTSVLSLLIVVAELAIKFFFERG